MGTLRGAARPRDGVNAANATGRPRGTDEELGSARGTNEEPGGARGTNEEPGRSQEDQSEALEDPPLCSAAAVASLLMALPTKTPWRQLKAS